MSLSQVLVLIVIVFPMLAVILLRLRMDLAALIVATLLAILQFAGLEILGPTTDPAIAIRTFSGFGRPTVIVLVCLFILTAALEKSGFTRWITYQILKIGGGICQSINTSFCWFRSFTLLVYK